MHKIILFLLIALVTWLILIVAGPDRYAEIIGAEASPLEVIMGIVGATIICHVYTSSTR
jgi:hypothetical protein